MFSQCRRLIPGLALWATFFVGGSRLCAAVVVHADRAAYESAAGGGLTLEDFEIAGLPATGLVLPLPALNATTDFPPVVPGSIAAGISFRSEPPIGSNQILFLAPKDFDFGNLPLLPSSHLFTQNVGRPLILEFSPDVVGVGLDVMAFDPSGNPVELEWTVEMGDSQSYSGILSNLPSGQTAFFGLTISGDSKIRKLTFAAPTNGQVGIDNVAFGGTASPVTEAIPEPASLIGWGVLLGIVAVGAGRRGRARKG